MSPEELKTKLSPEARAALEAWLTQAEYFSYGAEINQLIASGNSAELEDRFYKHVEVGTGGIRGALGAGPNRINLRTIGEAAQGLSQFIEDFGAEAKQKGVVVGHEARKMSEPFAELCCRVFAANGIKTYLFAGLRATPEISFAVRHLGASAGVQLTASHNPRTDNGFKFYWSDGGQVVPPADAKFMALVKNVSVIKTMDFAAAKQQRLIAVIGRDIDEAYLKAIRGLSLVKSRSAQVVFSPIHGAGSTNVLPVLKTEGFAVTVVPEQAAPDENFPTAKGDLINPEYPEVMELTVGLAEKVGADLALCSDPDADRIGVAVKKKLGANETQFLNGDEVGVVLAAFVLERLQLDNRLTPNSLVIETYVTTSLISDIAQSYGIKVIDDLLVGFKFIGEIIEKLPDKNDFIFAAEQSLGYLRGSFVRDKDAAIAALTITELASALKDKGQTVVDYLNAIYRRHSYYKNRLLMVEMEGRAGFANRDKIMRALRAYPPGEFAGLKVLKIIDRLPSAKSDPAKYVCGATGDQITFIFSEDEKTRLTVRPSGTEPKIKYYVQHHKKVVGDLGQTKQAVDQLASALEQSLLVVQKEIAPDA